MEERTGNIKQLKADYERLANMYMAELNELYELDPDYGYWAGNEVGGVYCNGDLFSVTFQDMILIVDYGIPNEEYMEWFDYCLWAHEFGQPEPNLKAWHAGCPRHSKETIDRLTELKRDLINNIKELTNKTIKEKWNCKM